MAVPTPIASLVTVAFCWILHLSLLLGAPFLVSPLWLHSAGHLVDPPSGDAVCQVGMCSLPGTGRSCKDECKRSMPSSSSPPRLGEAERLAPGALTLRNKCVTPRASTHSDGSKQGAVIQLGGIETLRQRGDKLSYLLNESVNR